MKPPRPIFTFALSIAFAASALFVSVRGQFSPIPNTGTFPVVTTSGGAIVGVNVQSFGASGARVVVQTTTSGTTNSGATTVTVASPGSAVPGLSIWIVGAGTSGNLYQSTITAANGNTLTLTAATSTTVSNGTYVQVGGPVTTTTSGSTTSGSVVVNVTSQATFAAGQGIYIAGAGTSSANYVGTIDSISGSAITITPATGTTVANGTLVQHDDSFAFQAAMTSLATTGGVITAPDGIYQINQPPQNTGTANAVLQLPTVGYIQNNSQYPQVPITLQGVTPAGCTDLAGFGSNSGSINRLNGTVIQTARTGCRLIGGYGPSGSTANFTNVKFLVQNITFRCASPGNETMVGCGFVSGMQISGCTFDTTAGSNPSQPTGGTAIEAPNSENDGNNRIDNVNICGYYQGVQFAEHTDGKLINFFATLRCMVPIGSDAYPSKWDNIIICNCPYAIYYANNASSGANAYPNVGPLEIHAFNNGNNTLGGSQAWTNTAYYVYDPYNNLSGVIYYAGTSANPMNQLGGAHLALVNLQNANDYFQTPPALAGISQWGQYSLDDIDSGGATYPLTVTQVGQQVVVTSPASPASQQYVNGLVGAITTSAGNFSSQSVSTRFVPGTNLSGTWAFTFGVGYNSPHVSGSFRGAMMQVAPGGNVVCYYTNSGGSLQTFNTTTYNTSTMAYLMIEETSSDIYFKYSSTGLASSWTAFGGSGVADPFTLTSGMNIMIEGNLSSDGKYDGYGTFDQLWYTASSNR